MVFLLDDNYGFVFFALNALEAHMRMPIEGYHLPRGLVEFKDKCVEAKLPCELSNFPAKTALERNQVVLRRISPSLTMRSFFFAKNNDWIIVTLRHHVRRLLNVIPTARLFEFKLTWKLPWSHEFTKK